MRTLTLISSLALLTMLSAGCGTRQTAKSKTAPTPLPARLGTHEQGIASWYGEPYHGRRAANGEVYDMNEMTAAHKTLPFETWVRVKNLSNKKWTEVRINDRGPFIAGRIIDLSHAAAQQIDLIGPGTARVRIEVIAAPKSYAKMTWFAIQIAAVADKRYADQLAKTASRFGHTAISEKVGSEPLLYRVMVGREKSSNAARDLLKQVRKEYKDAFVVKL